MRTAEEVALTLLIDRPNLLRIVLSRDGRRVLLIRLEAPDHDIPMTAREIGRDLRWWCRHLKRLRKRGALGVESDGRTACPFYP